VRQVAAVVAGAAAAAAGAIVLGEYDLSGRAALLAGLLFGVSLAEIVVSVGGVADVAMAAATALLAEGGLVWALWISTGHHLDLASGIGWAGVVVGALAAGVWIRSAGRRAPRTRSDP